MRKALCLTALGLLFGVGLSYGEDIPRNRGSILPGNDFPNYPAPILIRVGQAGYKFLSYPIGARAAALAGAFSTVVGDAHAVFWNPSCLAFMRAGRGEAFGDHTAWIGDITYEDAGLAYNVNGTNAIGFGLMTVDNGTIQGAKVNSAAPEGYELTDTFTLREYAITAAYARKVTDRFAIGGAFKMAYQDLGQGNILDAYNKPQVVSNRSNIWAFDLGTYLDTGFRTVSIGVNVNNFSRTASYQGETFELPRRVAMAFSADVLSLVGRGGEAHRATIHFEVEKPYDFSERALLGGEYLYQAPGAPFGMALRAGYRFNHDTESYSVGAGLKFKTPGGRGASVDYAYKRFNQNFFKSVQMVSGSVMF
jgi:hypothetical protein